MLTNYLRINTIFSQLPIVCDTDAGFREIGSFLIIFIFIFIRNNILSMHIKNKKKNHLRSSG